MADGGSAYRDTRSVMRSSSFPATSGIRMWSVCADVSNVVFKGFVESESLAST